MRPVTAKTGNRFITIIALDRQGNYQKLELGFDANYQHYQIWQTITDSPDLNIAILPKGVCATIVKDSELVIFVPKGGAVNKVQDKQVATDMTLFNWEDRVVYIQNGNIWSVRMR